MHLRFAISAVVFGWEVSKKARRKIPRNTGGGGPQPDPRKFLSCGSRRCRVEQSQVVGIVLIACFHGA